MAGNGRSAQKKGENGYPSETAGRLMVPAAIIPVVAPEMRIDAVRAMLEGGAVSFETINYIYVTGEGKCLLGVFSIKELFAADGKKEAQDIMRGDIVFVHPYTDQERIALLALEKNVKAIPVIDKEGEFLGVVQFDAILKVLDTESVEDMFRFGGLYHRGPVDDVLAMPVRKALGHRIPWLVIGLLGGMVAASIVASFEETIASNIILAAFIPLMVYMADAVGTQMEAFIIRDLAVNPKLKFLRYMFKQMYIVFILGLIMSAVLGAVSYFFYGKPEISMVLSFSLFFAICSSVLTGLVIPFFFSKIRLDPANASGPIATIIQDVLSVLVYFSVASWLL